MRAFFPLPKPPLCDLVVIARQQHFRDLASFPDTGSRVVGTVEQSTLVCLRNRREGVLLRRIRVTQHARLQPSDAVHKDQGSELSTGEHEIPKADFFQFEVFDDAFVNALVVATTRALTNASSNTSNWKKSALGISCSPVESSEPWSLWTASLGCSRACWVTRIRRRRTPSRRFRRQTSVDCSTVPTTRDPVSGKDARSRKCCCRAITTRSHNGGFGKGKNARNSGVLTFPTTGDP